MRNNHNRVPDFNSFKTSPGDQFHVEFASSFRPDGTIELKESGRVDIQKQINSHAAECDMAVIISKLQYGDTSVLSHGKPLYGDFTQFPKTYAEILDLVHRSNDTFQSLDPDIKVKYDNDVNKWFSAIGSESWLFDMGFSIPSAPSSTVPDASVSVEPSKPAVKE